MKQRVVLLGPPGSGKGTIASRLQEGFGYTHVSSGDWLRSEVERGTEIGRQAHVFLEKGELVPDKLVLELMERRLEAELGNRGFMLDGFPRTLTQAKALDEWLGANGKPLEAVLFYKCSVTVILDRVTGRRVCQKCGQVYHLRNHRPRFEGLCDNCGGPLGQRDDDTEPVLRKRLEVYARQTEPLVDYYEHQDKLSVIDATEPLDRIYADSAAALDR